MATYSKLKQSRRHVYGLAVSDPAIEIRFCQEVGVTPMFVESSYIGMYGDKAKTRLNEIIDLPPLLYSFGASHNILGAENALLDIETGDYFLEGISFATSPVSQSIMMEPIVSQDFSDICHLSFRENVICIASYEVYGHFLLQTCFKLVALKLLGSLNETLVIFAGQMPSRFLELLDVLNLLPRRYLICPNDVRISSDGLISILSSPINTVSTPLCSCMGSLQRFTLNNKLADGEFVAPDTWLNPRRAVSAALANNLRKEVLAFSPRRPPNLRKLPHRIYLPRRSGTHRGIANRDEVMKIAAKFGYAPIYLEDYSPVDQISILQHARHLIAEVGSTSCNTWLMPNLCSIIELSLTGAEIPWGPVLDSAIRPLKFYRIVGDRVEGTAKRHDGDMSKSPMPQDADFHIPAESLQSVLQFVNDGWPQ